MKKGVRVVGGCLFLLGMALGGPAAASPDVHAAGADPLRASAVQREQAQGRFVRGKELFEAQKFAEALEEFEASRAIVASPNAKLYRARCLLAMGRWVEAYNELGSTVVEAVELSKMEARYARTADAAARERAEVEKQLAFVRLSVFQPHAETDVKVNGEQIRRTAWSEPIPARAGTVTVSVTSPDRPPQEKQIQLTTGETAEVVFDAAPIVTPARAETAARTDGSLSLPEPTPRPYSGYAYAAAGVGAVGVGAFTVLGLMSNRSYNELEATCPGGNCAGDQAERIETGKSQQLWANVGLAVGVLGIGGAVTLFVLDGGDDREENRLSVGVTLDRVVLSGKL